MKLLFLLMFASSVQASSFDVDTYSTSLEFAQVTYVSARQNDETLGVLVHQFDIMIKAGNIMPTVGKL